MEWVAKLGTVLFQYQITVLEAANEFLIPLYGTSKTEQQTAISGFTHTSMAEYSKGQLRKFYHLQS